MLTEPPPEIEWLKPWESLRGSGDNLVKELNRELNSEHVLHGMVVAALARRIDCDDVLFATANSELPLAVVHLTWTGRRKRDPNWPQTTCYTGWPDWVERCLLPDHEQYGRGVQ
jgi:hypothetical protein